MKLIIEENEQKMSESAMHILLGAMMQDKRVNITLTAGKSPNHLTLKTKTNLKMCNIIYLMKHLI